MSQITYRGNLSAASFPFISENFGRSIIVPQYDNNFNRQTQSSEDVDKDIGIPQAYYMHNCMPHPQGLQSIGYTPLLSGGLANFQGIAIIRDSGDNKVFVGMGNDGKIYVSGGGAWVLKITVLAGALITFAFVSGVTYMYVAGQGCFKYDFGSAAFVPVVLVGLVPVGAGQTIGICASAGYMIAWNATAVAWSSTTDPTDFVTSLITGAGGGSVEGAKGAVNFCVAHLLGFIVYTSANAVAALFSGNARFPYNFREIVASGGVASLDLIAYDANSGNHYAYTTSGMQLINTSQSQTAFPELTDFIAGKLFEDFNETTNTFVTTILTTTTMKKKINVIADRYLLISYGVSSLTHCLVYDLTQKRWGKLKTNHVSTFEYQIPNTGITEIPRQSIGFLTTDGSISVVDFSVNGVNQAGVLITGKYQFVRPRLLQMDEINLENIRVGAAFTLTLFTALDGKNYTQSTPYLDLSSGLFRRYKTRQIGINHSLLFKGAFEVCSLVLAFNITGKR